MAERQWKVLTVQAAGSLEFGGLKSRGADLSAAAEVSFDDERPLRGRKRPLGSGL